MENSPNPLKRSNRLSFNSKHFANESPKTPIRNKKLNNGFETPPSMSKLNNVNNNFGEESPSQDYDYSLIPMSQDVITRYRDVTWKWNDENDIQQPISKKQFRPAIVQKDDKSSGIVETQQKIDKTKGFYKFQELLLAEGGNLKKLLNKKVNCDNKCETTEKLESNFKEKINTAYDKSRKYTTNYELKSENKNKIGKLLQKSNENDCRKFNKIDEIFSVNTVEENLKKNDIINLLDDSDSDNLLVKLTQDIENNIQSSKSSTATSDEGSLVVNIGKRKNNLTNIKKISHFDNDSIDELMLTLPMDEHILISTDESISNSCGIKSSFLRHNSMPPQIQQIKNLHNNAPNSFIRHSSANCLRTQINISPKSYNININREISPFSDGSLDSLSTAVSDYIPQTRKCTKAEVERKRQEAKLRRLKSQQRREFTHKIQLMKK